MLPAQKPIVISDPDGWLARARRVRHWLADAAGEPVLLVAAPNGGVSHGVLLSHASDHEIESAVAVAWPGGEPR